jgi:hypothetical protein
MVKWSKKVHISWLIGWFCLAFLIGAALCVRLPPAIFMGGYTAVCAAVLCLVGFASRRKPMLALILIAGCLFGLWRGSSLRHQLNDYQAFMGQPVRMEGKVAQDTAIGPKGDQRIVLTDVMISRQALAGDVWVSVGKTDIKRGDIVVLEGMLGEGFGNMPASMHVQGDRD